MSATPHAAVLDVWYTRCAVPTPFGLAQRLGLFSEAFSREAGIRLRALQESPSFEVQQSHYTHTQPDSFRFGGNGPALWARASGAETRLIGISAVTLPQVILARPDAGIDSLEDLAGKRLLLLRRPAEPIDFWYAVMMRIYTSALAEAGLEWRDVIWEEQRIERRFVHDHPGGSKSLNAACVGAPASPNTLARFLIPLIRGEVDAVATQHVYASQLAALLGLKVIFNLSDKHAANARANNDYPYVFCVSSDLLARRPEVVDAILARVLLAAEAAHRDLGATVRAVALEQGVSEEIVEATYGSTLLDGFATDLAPWKLAMLEAQKRFLIEQGLLGDDVDLDAWVDHGPLARARAQLEQARTLG